MSTTSKIELLKRNMADRIKNVRNMIVTRSGLFFIGEINKVIPFKNTTDWYS